MSVFLRACLLLVAASSAPFAVAEEPPTKKIGHALHIRDLDMARALSEEALRQDPDNKELMRLQIRVLAALQDEAPLLRAYHVYRTRYPSDSIDEEVLLDVVWAVMYRSAKNASPIIRADGALFAFFADDARGVPRVYQGLIDQNSQVRAYTVALCAQARDELLQKKVLALAACDPSDEVRCAAISALGAMRLCEAKDLLYAFLEGHGPTDEKILAVQALGDILSSADPAVVERLACSDRAALRMLACELVIEHDAAALIGSIIPLMRDTNHFVRLAATQCVGVVHPHPVPTALLDELQSLCPQAVAPELRTTTAWFLMTRGAPSHIAFAETVLTDWLASSDAHLRRLASALLSHAGPPGSALSLKALEQAKDEIVRLNLAIGLIRQRVSVDMARRAITEALSRCSMRLTWEEMGVFRYVSCNLASHEVLAARIPETEDLITRLDLYGILATAGLAPSADELRQCLQDSTWGVSAASADLLLQEGDGSVIETLRTLLNAKEGKIAIQAALVLAIFTQDPQARALLHTAYPSASRELKEHILLGIGSIGAEESLPLLISALDEPFPSLRLRAAWAIHACLFH